MRKILITITALMIFTPKVFALDYFWSDKKLDDYELISTEERFKFYKEEKEGKYIDKREVSQEYAFEDINDIKYEKIGDYQDSCTESNYTYIEYKTVYPYKLIPKGKYFSLNNIAKDLELKNLEIYCSDEKINYDVVKCTNCNSNIIRAGGSILLSLDKEVVVGRTNLNIESSGQTNFSYYGYFYDNNMTLIKNIHLFTSKNNYLVDDYNYIYDNFQDIYYQDEEVEKDHIKYPLEKKEMCQVNNILTFRYNIVKKYYDDNYYKDLGDKAYIKDKNSTKIFYKYLKKENNNPIINEEDYSDSIETASTIEEYPANTGYQKPKYKSIKSILYIFIISIITIYTIFKLKKMST